MLLEEENKQLKDALINKKKKQQRSKALLLELAPKYNRGGLVLVTTKGSRSLRASSLKGQ